MASKPFSVRFFPLKAAPEVPDIAARFILGRFAFPFDRMRSGFGQR